MHVFAFFLPCLFVCFLFCNDFFPHLPSIDIGTGGLTQLFHLYKYARTHSLFHTNKGHLIENGNRICSENLCVFLKLLSNDEVQQLKMGFLGSHSIEAQYRLPREGSAAAQAVDANSSACAAGPDDDNDINKKDPNDTAVGKDISCVVSDVDCEVDDGNSAAKNEDDESWKYVSLRHHKTALNRVV